jgi:hypothetical protein
LTPLFQAAVNNHLHQKNLTSFYGESLLSIFGLPLLNWGLIFKPQLWAFLVLPPSFAYSLYWASMAALMLVGWSVLLRRFGFARRTAALVATLLFFSPFVQAWWTVFDSQLGFFPWVVLAVVSIRRDVYAAAALAVLIPVWWISFLYVPGLPPLFYLGLALSAVFCLSSMTPGRLVAIVSGAGLGAGLAFLYFRPIFGAYTHSVFPGERWIHGGELPGWIVLSQFLPGTTTELYTSLIGRNICEVSTVATWLPALALCTLDVGAIRRGAETSPEMRRDLKRIGFLLLALTALTLWQVTSFLGPMSYLAGFGLSPEQRTLFASGALLVIAAAYVVDRLPIRVSVWRLGLFGVLVLASWVLASFELQPTHELVLRDELLVLVPLLAVIPFAMPPVEQHSLRAWRTAIILLALIPVVAEWGIFNPVQRTDVMFRRPDTEVTRALNRLAEKRPDHAIAVPGFAGGVLNGVGYRSVSHVLPTPSPKLFRPYFGDMNEAEFNVFFNRYANVGVADVKRPSLLTADYLQLPISRMAPYAAVP